LTKAGVVIHSCFHDIMTMWLIFHFLEVRYV
jgi:hypothetical protein